MVAASICEISNLHLETKSEALREQISELIPITDNQIMFGE